jgi:uncharacterized protein
MPDNVYHNLKKVIYKYQNLIPTNVLSRELVIYQTSLRKANVIVGPRRSGKTFLLYKLISKHKNFIFINFEDNLLFNLKKEHLNYILDISKEMFKEKVVFFFDEVQVVDDWENFIISLLNEDYKVYVTGSNSKLLSKDISTSLRGKSLSYLLLPFSFREVIFSKNVFLDKDWYLKDQKILVKNIFQEYFLYGGFPEVILSSDVSLKNKLINNYFESVIYKDLVERLNLKNTKLIDITIKYVLNVFSNEFSISKFENYLKSNKLPYSFQDVYLILNSLQDIYFCLYVKEYNKSFKKSEISKSKIYVIDVGYIHFLSYKPEDKGRILENLVFIELFKRNNEVVNKNIFYYRENNFECDFVFLKDRKNIELFQVTFTLNQNNYDREVKGLLKAMDFFKVDVGKIITYDMEDKIIINKKEILIIPIYKWLLENIFKDDFYKFSTKDSKLLKSPLKSKKLYTLDEVLKLKPYLKNV